MTRFYGTRVAVSALARQVELFPVCSPSAKRGRRLDQAVPLPNTRKSGPSAYSSA